MSERLETKCYIKALYKYSSFRFLLLWLWGRWGLTGWCGGVLVIGTLDLLWTCHDPFHWLRVLQRISYKLAVLTYRAINGTAPGYLQACFTRLALMSSRQRLWSSVSHRLALLICRQASLPNTWNDLLFHVTSAPSLAIFRQHLKTFLFTCSYRTSSFD